MLAIMMRDTGLIGTWSGLDQTQQSQSQSGIFPKTPDHLISGLGNITWAKCYALCWDYLSPGFGSGWTRSSDGRGFSDRVAALTRLSRPGFQSRTEGSSRGAAVRRAERWEAMSAEWAVFHSNDIR